MSFQLVSELRSPDWSFTACRIAMSTTCEVPFEPLSLDGSNYSSWSAHVLNVLRTMGLSFEQIVDESILPNDFDNLFKLSNEEMKCLINNRRVVNLLIKNMDRESSDLIHKNDKLKETWFDAHHLWKFIESICEEDDDDEDQEDEEESLEECTITATHSLPLPWSFSCFWLSSTCDQLHLKMLIWMKVVLELIAFGSTCCSVCACPWANRSDQL